MTTPTYPPSLTLRVAGQPGPFLILRPELYPRLGPVVAEILADLRRGGVAVEIEGVRDE